MWWNIYLHALWSNVYASLRSMQYINYIIMDCSVINPSLLPQINSIFKLSSICAIAYYAKMCLNEICNAIFSFYQVLKVRKLMACSPQHISMNCCYNCGWLNNVFLRIEHAFIIYIFLNASQMNYHSLVQTLWLKILKWIALKPTLM